MQQSRFSVLTGHLNDYPLPDLVGILRHQQKTGRLLLEYQKAPAMLFFKDGELVDAQFDQLSGLQALCVVFAQPTALFNFNPLIKPYRRTIDSSLQKAVSELLGCWDESAIEIQNASAERQRLVSVSEQRPALGSAIFENVPVLSGTARTVLSLPPGPTTSRRYSPSVMAMAAAGLLMLGASAFIGVSRGLIPTTSSSAAIVSAPALSETPAKAPDQEIGVSDRPTRNRTERESLTRTRERKDVDSQSTSEVVMPPVVASESSPEPVEQTRDSSDKSEAPPSRGGSVRVILQVENGRVTQASIGNPKPGREAYETMALRIARQRRYPGAASGQQTVTIKVD